MSYQNICDLKEESGGGKSVIIIANCGALLSKELSIVALHILVSYISCSSTSYKLIKVISLSKCGLTAIILGIENYYFYNLYLENSVSYASSFVSPIFVSILSIIEK